MRLKDNSNEKGEILDKKTKTKHAKKVSKSKEIEGIEVSNEAHANLKDKSTKTTKNNEKVVFLDKKDEIELKDEINNARKKRRRSSANIE